MAKRSTIKHNPLSKPSGGDILDEITGTVDRSTVERSAADSGADRATGRVPDRPTKVRRGRPPGENTKVFSTKLAVDVLDRISRAVTWTTPRTTVREIVERAITAELDRMEEAYVQTHGHTWPDQ